MSSACPKENGICDLRSFLKVLEEQRQLHVIKKEVALEYEIGDVLVALERKGLGAALFENVRGHNIPVVGGVLGSQERIALALGCEKSEVVDRVASCFENPIPPVEVDWGYFDEVVATGDEVDLGSLPIPRHARGDAGPFITAGVTVSKDPETGVQNLSFQRMQVKGKNRLGIMINEWRHLKGFLDKAESRHEPLPIAVAIGVDPVISIAAGFRYDGDEAELAGALRGKPLEVKKCFTSDIRVPSRTEILIEGIILPGEREEEGPLAEFTGHYGEPWKNPVVKVTAIARRKAPIYQTLAGASYEHINLGNVLPREPLLKKFCTYVSKNVKAVHIPPYGSGFLAIISMDKKNPGEPKNVALAAMMTYVNIKHVIVVDPDVDIFDAGQVMWALSTRVKPERDVFYVPYAQGHELDPSADHRGVHTKVGIDATLEDDLKAYYKKVVYQDVDIEKYL
ncbi:MAG TPA: UbiD family decarboxylase [Clostridia bacterium]|nr:UbiD family decarboxylase [Clostridia bacterium]